MAKMKKLRKKNNPPEPDSLFFLKLVVILIVGSQWIFIESSNWQIPIPVGLIVGLVLVTHEHFQIDRKIEYALLLIASFVAFWLPVGLVIKL